MSYIRDPMVFTEDEIKSEKWIRVPETITDYEVYVSDLGRLKRFKKGVAYVTLGSFDKRGYLRTSFTKNKKRKTYKVHRLVCSLFLEDFQDSLTVNHIDFNKKNNRLSNLELVSSKENVMHFIKNNTKLSSSSRILGISFHKGISKWTSRVTFEGKRYFLGSFDSEEEAIDVLETFNRTLDTSMLKIGKGVSNLGKSKYSLEEDLEALKLSKEIGIRKAGEITGMGSTRISTLRRKYKEQNIEY